jgi:tetratricopeptide (TPR) repeat protein
VTSNGEILRGVVLLVFLILLVGWVVVLTVRKSEDPAQMIFKWILTAGVVAFIMVVVMPLVGKGGYAGAFGGIPMAAACGIVLAIIWGRILGGMAARPLTSLFDGGNQEPVPHPAYSIAQSRQKQGKYLEAVAEVRKQLDRFPTDLEGHLLLAQILAEDLKDLPAAETTIQQLCAQPGHAPKNLAFALYSLADWHLEIGRDREGARRALNQIVETFPESEFALGAAQRIARLGGPEMTGPLEEKKYTVTEGPRNLGLLKDYPGQKAPEIQPSQVATDLIQHLSQHPLDSEAREKLAVVYADHYGRLDLAADQLEQMIQQPNQPARLIVHWLNLLADLQVRCGSDYETVKQTLERIIERGPKLAAAEIARNRLGLLRLELKSKPKAQAVKMGTYEQNIGLKRGLPPH